MKNYLNFKNKISVITGAGSGIGREVSIKLADLGSTVILVGRSNKVKKVEKHKHMKKIKNLSGSLWGTTGRQRSPPKIR